MEGGGQRMGRQALANINCHVIYSDNPDKSRLPGGFAPECGQGRYLFISDVADRLLWGQLHSDFNLGCQEGNKIFAIDLLSLLVGQKQVWIWAKIDLPIAFKINLIRFEAKAIKCQRCCRPECLWQWQQSSLLGQIVFPHPHSHPPTHMIRAGVCV